MRVNIGLGGWILGDGNYPGFRSGDEARFALEFSDQEGFVPTGHSGPSLEPLHEITPIYESSGTVVYVAPKV